MPTKRYTPAPYCPTISATGSEEQVTLSGENMWLRTSRFGTTYAEGYSGSLDLSESIATKTLTAATSITTTAGSKTVTGVGTAFVSELHLGSFVFIPRAAQGADLLVVEKIVSDTVFIASRAAQYSSGGTAAYVLPVIFPIGSDRGTLVRGNAVQFPRGHYLAVGDGTLRINGTALNATLAASRTPRFALYDAAAGTYTQDDVGIAKPLTLPTLAAAATGDRTLTNATNATPIVCTTAAAHRLHNGQQITISGVTGNTAANGTFYIKKNTATTFSLYSDANLTTAVAGNGAYAAGGTISLPASIMRAGDYNIRISAYSSKTLGYSQPSDIGPPVTLVAGQMISITFNTAMAADQDGYIIWGTEYADNSTAQIDKRYMGPWYEVARITKKDLIDDAHTAGSETGTVYEFSYADGEIASATNLISFNNFTPVDAEFVDLINGIPLYFSCLGKGTTSKSTTSPGPACVPSKPSNPEGVFLNKAITTAGGDTIIGEFNAKSRIYALCQNSLQTLILTTLEEEPITFRSLWNCGFRNPYNVAFVKEYLYGFGTQKIVRSVAGGDDSTVEFEFASDVRDLVNAWATGHVLVGYDPKNRAVCFFYTAAEVRSGRYITKVLPFLLDKQIWNPPIILSLADRDCIVSGVATIDDKLVFIAGGETDANAIFAGTYVFDGGDSQAKDWYLAWNFSDDGQELHPKRVSGFTVTGRFASASTAIKLYGIQAEGALDYSALAAGTGASKSFTIGANASGNPTTGRKRLRKLDWGPLSTYTVRISGSHTTTVDRLDEIVLDVEVNSSET
jgi:hypothetical protein